MKKIIEGFFYRMIKSYEFWGLIVLLVCSCIYINADMFANETSLHGPFYVEENEVGRDVSGDEVKAYQFAATGVSAADAYKYGCEPIAQESFDKLLRPGAQTSDEVFFLLKGISSLNLIPTILIVLFIPIFFGRMFSDGTLKNLISCGHGKGKIYLASLIFSFALDLFMFLFNMIVYLIMIPINGWKPPVYLPVVLMMFAISVAMMFTITSVVLAVLYASSKKTASFVAGFILAMLLFFPVTLLTFETIDISYVPEENSQEHLDEYREIFMEEGGNAFTYKYDLSSGMMCIYYGDRLIVPTGGSALSPAVKNTMLAVFYLDPTSCTQLLKHAEFSPYMAYRDGLMAISVASNIFWLLLSTAVGIIVFKKREIHC